MDEVGLDVGNHVARDLSVRLPGSMPPDGATGSAIAKMIEKGWLGRKAGKGFYAYAGGKKDDALPPLNPEMSSVFQPGVSGPGGRRACCATAWCWSWSTKARACWRKASSMRPRTWISA